MRVVIVTGMSGAGKSTALRALEDLDYYAIDNFPLPLLDGLMDLVSRLGKERVALVVDAREGPFLEAAPQTLANLRAAGHQLEVLFLDSSDDTLLRRFQETRRRHPLSGDDLREGIAREREMLQVLRRETEALVDTENLTVHQLKGIIQERYGRKQGQLAFTLLSFGFKHGLPAEADLVFDVRFLPNPYFIEKLSGLTGKEASVVSFVLDNDDAKEFLDLAERLLTFAKPRYEREGKAYLTVAVGCTGGRHRSVAFVEALARRMQATSSLTVRHRDLEKS